MISVVKKAMREAILHQVEHFTHRNFFYQNSWQYSHRTHCDAKWIVCSESVSLRLNNVTETVSVLGGCGISLLIARVFKNFQINTWNAIDREMLPRKISFLLFLIWILKPRKWTFPCANAQKKKYEPKKDGKDYLEILYQMIAARSHFSKCLDCAGGNIITTKN